MFQDELAFAFRNFKRFEIGGRQSESEALLGPLGLGEENENLVRSILHNADENLKAAHCFLAGIGDPDESLTQHVFNTFLTDLMGRLDQKKAKVLDNHASARNHPLRNMSDIEDDIGNGGLFPFRSARKSKTEHLEKAPERRQKANLIASLKSYET